MAIIDAQIHLWRKGTPTPPHIERPYLVDDAIRDMDEAGVDGAVIHPPASWDPDSNEQAVEAVRAYPDALRDPRQLPARQSRRARALIADLEAAAGHARAALLLQQAAQADVADGRHLDWLWPAAEKAGVPVALLAGDFLPLFGQIAGAPSRPEADRRPHGRAARRQGRRGVRRHARSSWRWRSYPNVAVKLTGGPFYADDAYPVPKPAQALSRHVRRLRSAAAVLGHRHHQDAVLVARSA